jgi:hypothetical protein
MRRFRVLALAVLLSTASQLLTPSPVGAWSHACDGPYANPPGFAGIVESHSPVIGARSKIEWNAQVNPVLCTTGWDSFASSWVGIVGSTSVYSIFQIGIDKCQGGACSPYSGADNSAYYFWAYGRPASALCGAAVGPVPHMAPLGYAQSATYWFQILRSGSDYQARIAGQVQYSIPVWIADSCWDGVTGAQFLNEVWDKFDQTPGRVGNKQSWLDATWTNSAGTLVPVSRPFGSTCDLHDRSSMGCTISGSQHDSWDTWDTRQP